VILKVRILLIWLALAYCSQAAAQMAAAAGSNAPENSGTAVSVPPLNNGQLEQPSVPSPEADSAGADAPPQRAPVISTEPWFDEVHIRPRIAPETNSPKGIDTEPPPRAEVSARDAPLKTYVKPIRVDVDLVLIPVSVNDPMARQVIGLEKESFALFENGKQQDIRYFSSEDAPVSLGVIFDVSGSMANKIAQAQEAVVDFFKTANPEDEFFLITFSDTPEVLSDFTQSVENIQSKLIFARPKGRTALLDAIYLGVSKMRQAKYERKALLIISDGGDNHSRYTAGEIKSLVREADVQIYAVGIFSLAPQTPEELEGPELLSEVAEVTGGQMFTVDNPNQLADTAAKIGTELRNQYVLGYRPSNSVHDGKWRKIKVKLHPPKKSPPLTIYARTGYYAPSE
jgi:Ca-activated chloride channel family protein